MRATAERLPPVLIPLLPGALVVGLGFRAGGFFPHTVALAALVVLVALVLRLTLAARPLEGLGPAAVVVAAALALLAGWTLASAGWSDARWRALVEYDRVLLYLLVFALLATWPRSAGAARWLVRGLALGAVAVCLAGLLSRVVPDVVTAGGDVANRLRHPVTYWNALGLLAGMGLALCLALTCDARERAPARALAAAALPLLAATLVLTVSRGAIAVAAGGLLVVLLAGRPAAAVGGLLAAVPSVAVAAVATYRADLLVNDEALSAAATEQGHDLALVLALCAAGAAGVRLAALALDRRAQRLMLPAAVRRPAVVAAACAAVVAIAAGIALAAGAPGAVERQYDRFLAGDQLATTGDARSRLTDLGNNGRLDQWEVALDGFRAEPLRGQGAGTYSLLWERDRQDVYQVEDGHSLYLELLAELGLVGLILLGAAVAAGLVALLLRSRGADRVAWAGLLAVGLMWTAHAGIDWDWEMPVVTAPVFAAAGLALARPAGHPGAPGGLPRLARVVAGLALLALALTPARVLLSEGPARDSARAFLRGDCATSVDRALDAVETLGSRPEPHAVMGYCNVRLGRPDLAVTALERAVDRDPRNWEFRYGLALVRGAAGRDPRGEAREALRLNPGEPLARDAVRRFATRDPQVWRRRARSARLPTQ